MTSVATKIPATLSNASKASDSSWMPSFLDNITSWWTPKQSSSKTEATIPPSTVRTIPEVKSLHKKVFDSSATDAEAARQGSSRSKSRRGGSTRGRHHFRHGKPWDAFKNGIHSLSRYDQDKRSHNAPDYSKISRTLGIVDTKTGLTDGFNRITRHGLTEQNLDGITGNNSQFRTRKVAGVERHLDMSKNDDRYAYSTQTSLCESGKKAAARAPSWYADSMLGKRLTVLSDYYRTRETARDILGLPSEEAGTIEGLSEKPEVWTLPDGSKRAVARSSLLRECSMSCNDKAASEFASTITEAALQAGYTGVDFVLHGNLNHTLGKGIESQARKAHRKCLEEGGIPEGFDDLSTYAHDGQKDERSLWNNLETQHIGFKYNTKSTIVADTDAKRDALRKFDEVDAMMREEEAKTRDTETGYGIIKSITMAPDYEKSLAPETVSNYVYSTCP